MNVIVLLREKILTVLMTSLLPLASCDACILLVVQDLRPTPTLPDPGRPPCQEEVAVKPETPGPLKVDI